MLSQSTIGKPGQGRPLMTKSLVAEINRIQVLPPINKDERCRFAIALNTACESRLNDDPGVEFSAATCIIRHSSRFSFAAYS